MREHGFCFRETGQTRAHCSRCFERGSTCHAPKGAAARCCSFKALGRASLCGSWYVAPFVLGPGNAMKEQLEQYVNLLMTRHQECRYNEQATKQALIAPLF